MSVAPPLPSRPAPSPGGARRPATEGDSETFVRAASEPAEPPTKVDDAPGAPGPRRALARASSELDTVAQTKFAPAELGGDGASAADLEHTVAQPAAPTAERAPASVPLSTAPASLPAPLPELATASGPSPACPQCEAPMAWVEQHLRFYCKSCRMYF